MIMEFKILFIIDLLNAFVYFNENLHCCNGCRHDVTCSRRECNVIIGHNIIYHMTLSTEQQLRHMINMIWIYTVFKNVCRIFISYVRLR